jgi:3-oxoacyl-[acyl-carrier-protein] synthase-1
MSRSVDIAAVGARTPIGLTAVSSAAAARAGISRVGAHPFMVDANGDRLKCAYDTTLDPALVAHQRIVMLAQSALDQIFEQLKGGQSRRDPLPVLLALPDLRPGFTREHAQWVAQVLTDHAMRAGVPVRVELCGAGHAAVLAGIETATLRISKGQIELCVVLGADSYFDADTLDWLAADRRLAGEGVRSGFAPGEAAGALLLSSRNERSARKLPSLATIRGVASSTEARVLHGDEDVLGIGLAQAIATATSSLRLPNEAIDFIYCDINGERYRSDEWGFAVMRVQHVWRDAAYVAPADCWGDVGAATAALNSVLAAHTWARNHARGPRALIWASSDRGLRGAAVLERSQG